MADKGCGDGGGLFGIIIDDGGIAIDWSVHGAASGAAKGCEGCCGITVDVGELFPLADSEYCRINRLFTGASGPCMHE